MEDLRRRCRIGDLNIILGGQLKEAFEARARMFRTLAFKSMWQVQHETTQPMPFVFRARYELVDDNLRDIAEIAELRLPNCQRVRIIQTVAILKSQNADLRK